MCKKSYSVWWALVNIYNCAATSTVNFIFESHLSMLLHKTGLFTFAGVWYPSVQTYYIYPLVGERLGGFQVRAFMNSTSFAMGLPDYRACVHYTLLCMWIVFLSGHLTDSIVYDDDDPSCYKTLKFLAIWSICSTISVVVLICIFFITTKIERLSYIYWLLLSFVKCLLVFCPFCSFFAFF